MKAGRILRSPLTLGAAVLLVGIAIVWDAAGGRALNGVGGILWVASCVTMARSRWLSGSQREVMSGLVLAMVVCLAVLVKPSDGVITILGFGTAGVVVALVARQDAVHRSVLVPAAWLPVHLAFAIGTSVVRAATGGEASVRTDPPPTTAFVPLLMVIAAWGGTAIVVRLRDRHRQSIGRSLAGDPA